MNDEKYYDKAMKLFDKAQSISEKDASNGELKPIKEEEKALSLLKKGASKGELKSIMKLIDIKIEDFVSFFTIEIERKHEPKPNKLLESTLRIYKLFDIYSVVDPEILEEIDEIAKYLEMAITKDKSLIYDLGCLYTCMAFGCYSYSVIKDVSNGKIDDNLVYMNDDYLKKAFITFEKNLDDVRNIEMYLGYIYCFWEELNLKEKFNSEKNIVLESILERKDDYIEKTNYLRMPMKIYFNTKNYDLAEKVALKLLAKTGDDESIDSKAAHYVLDGIAESKGEFSEENRVKSREFGYDKSAQIDSEFGLLNTIHALYEKTKLPYNDCMCSAELSHDLSKINKDEYDKLFSHDDKYIINLIKENNEPSYEDCLWKYYALKYIETNDLKYYVKYVDEYIRCNTYKGKTISNPLKVDMVSEFFNYKDEYLLGKAIEYSKYIELVLQNENEDISYYDDINKISDLSLEPISTQLEKVIPLRAIYEYKNNGIINDVIKKFLIEGLCVFDSTEVYEFEDGVSFEDGYSYDEIDLIDDDYLEILKKKYDSDKRKYEFKNISDIKDNLSSLSKLAIKKYSKDNNEKFKDIVKLANNDNFLDNFKAESEFDLNVCDTDEYYIMDAESKYKREIISNGIKDIIFDCLLNIYKNENNLDELKKELLKHKNRIRTKEYVIRIDNELNQPSNDDKILSKLDELKEGQTEIKNNLNIVFDMLSDEINNLKIQNVDDDELVGKVTDKMIDVISDKFDDLKKQISDDQYNKTVEHIKQMFGTEYDKLDSDSKKMLTTAYLTFTYLNNLSGETDYSGTCILVSKVVEKEIKQRVYTDYMEYRRNNGLPLKIQLDKKTINNDGDFTLGSVSFLLGNVTKKPNDDFVSYVKNSDVLVYDNENEIESILRNIGHGCAEITKKYRNKSAHIGTIKLEEAKDCFDYIVETTKFLVKSLGKFKY